MAMIRPPGIGTLAHAGSASIGAGGAESNVAITATRLGATALWISRLGTDPFGEAIEAKLRSAGLQVLLSYDQEHRSGFAVREQRTLDRTRVTYYRANSAAASLSVEALPQGALEAIAQAEILHVSGINLAAGAELRDTTFRIARLARKAGTLVSFDINHRATLWSEAEAHAVLNEFLPLTDICFAGDDEARIALGSSESDPAALAQSLLAHGPSTVAIKLGAVGALAATSKETLRQGAFPVTVVDTIGAGDSFVGGFLSGQLAGLPLKECLDRAVRCGAITCGTAGDWEGAPSLSELDTLLDLGDPVIR